MSKEHTQYQERLRTPRRISGKLARIAAASALILSSQTIAAPSVQAAVGCWGDWCSGQDPNTTGCVNGAVTLAQAPIIQYYTLVEASGGRRVSEEKGTIELRWSPTCKTKWARASIHRAADISKVVVKQATGYTQAKHTSGLYGATGPGIYYTNMIYTPGIQCYAYIDGNRLESNSTRWE